MKLIIQEFLLKTKRKPERNITSSANHGLLSPSHVKIPHHFFEAITVLIWITSLFPH
jgi:hypothetical protein